MDFTKALETDGRTDGRTDGQSLLMRCEDASKKGKKKKVERNVEVYTTNERMSLCGQICSFDNM